MCCSNVDGSRQQVAVAHGAELMEEFARYEALGGDPLSSDMLKRAKAAKTAAKRQRESEYALERHDQVEARKRGRTIQVFNPYAAARTQEEVARRWEQLNEAGRARAKVQFQADKKAYAELTAGQKRSRAAPANPEPKYKRHTSTQEDACPQPPGTAGVS